MSYVEVQGQKVTFGYTVPQAAKGGGRRSEVKGFSDASRKRLIEKFLTVNHTAMGLPLFVTLTYPAVYPTIEKSKQHLKNLWKRWRTKYGDGISAVWRLELQKRGAPHYHLVVWGVVWIDNQVLATDWYEVVGSGDGRHLQAGTQVEKVRSENGVQWYASKYIAKTDLDATTGRVWGILGRANMVYYPKVRMDISTEKLEAFAEKYDTTVRKRSNPRYGFTLYGREVASEILDGVDNNSNHVVT